LDGHPHGLKDYAGQALVLCFWNRGCTWSLRTLSTLDALAAEKRGQPVAFLGVSADRNPADAAFVWRTLAARFPTVMDLHEGHSVASSLGVDSFPTTVVIDPCGIVRRIRTGHSFRLSSALASELQRLASGIPVAAAKNESKDTVLQPGVVQ
jgi:peroxiredoxin